MSEPTKTVPSENREENELSEDDLKDVSGGAFDSYLIFPTPPSPPPHKP